MAAVKLPAYSPLALGTLGLSVAWGKTATGGGRASGVTANARGASQRQEAITAINADAYDQWPWLTAAQRTAWSAWNRGLRRRRAGRWLWTGDQQRFSGANVVALDRGGSLLTLPPFYEQVAWIDSLDVQLHAGSPRLTIDWTLGNGAIPGSAVDVWLVWSRSTTPVSVRSRGWRHAAYGDGSSGHIEIDGPADVAVTVGVRAVSPHGRTFRSWLLTYLRPTV